MVWSSFLQLCFISYFNNDIFTNYGDRYIMLTADFKYFKELFIIITGYSFNFLVMDFKELLSLAKDNQSFAMKKVNKVLMISTIH